MPVFVCVCVYAVCVQPEYVAVPEEPADVAAERLRVFNYQSLVLHALNMGKLYPGKLLGVFKMCGLCLCVFMLCAYSPSTWRCLERRFSAKTLRGMCVYVCVCVCVFV